VIDPHCNSSYRKTNPSLHYLALDKSDFDFFLSFSECELKDPDRSTRQKKLNVLEVSGIRQWLVQGRFAGYSLSV
jgi:hypothetical protein